MPNFELIFAINNVDDDTIQDIYDRHDALVHGTAASTLLTITAEAPTAQEAAQAVVTDLERHTKTRASWCFEEPEPDAAEPGSHLPTAQDVEEINRWLEVHHALQED